MNRLPMRNLDIHDEFQTKISQKVTVGKKVSKYCGNRFDWLDICGRFQGKESKANAWSGSISYSLFHFVAFQPQLNVWLPPPIFSRWFDWISERSSKEESIEKQISHIYWNRDIGAAHWRINDKIGKNIKGQMIRSDKILE